MSVVAFLKHVQASPVLTLQDVSVWIDANTLAWVVFDLKGNALRFHCLRTALSELNLII
jgi:hypothetical protein